MKSKGVLFLSNGRGEDAINCQILKALRAFGADVDVSAMPVVGDGAQMGRSTVPIIGPTSELPTPTRLGYGVGFHPHGRLPQQPWIFYVQSVLVLHPLRWQ